MAIFDVGRNPTLADWKNALGPDNIIADVIEVLTQHIPILEDIPWMEGNLTDGHRNVIRTGLPEGTWRGLYQSVKPTKARRAQIKDTCGMLEAFIQTDKKLANLGGQRAAFLADEMHAHMEGINQQMAKQILFGETASEPAAFTGLAPRFNDKSAENGDNIFDAGGTGSDNQSIWLVGWGSRSCTGIVPRGSTAGLQFDDLGEETSEDENGGLMRVYRQHFTWDAGLHVPDWRYVVRICNIDKSLLQRDASSGANLPDLMFDALDVVPETGSVKWCWYMSRTVRRYLRKQVAQAVKESTLTMEHTGGAMVTAFEGIPIRRVDALAADEARVT